MEGVGHGQVVVGAEAGIVDAAGVEIVAGIASGVDAEFGVEDLGDEVLMAVPKLVFGFEDAQLQ